MEISYYYVFSSIICPFFNARIQRARCKSGCISNPAGGIIARSHLFVCHSGQLSLSTKTILIIACEKSSLKHSAITFDPSLCSVLCVLWQAGLFIVLIIMESTITSGELYFRVNDIGKHSTAPALSKFRKFLHSDVDRDFLQTEYAGSREFLQKCKMHMRKNTDAELQNSAELMKLLKLRR